MERFPVTLLVIALNEEANIGRCLDSVPFADEKLVVDSGSTDDTAAVARRHGARVIHQPWLGFGAQRNFASGQARHDWILFLDADETLSAELVEECRRRLPELIRSDAPGAYLPRRATYMGRPMRWYRPMVGEKIGRLYHRDRARWSEPRVHETLLLDGGAWEFRHPFHHHHSPTLVHKQLKVTKYAELKALEWRDRGRSPGLWGYPLVFLGTFLKDYVVRLAFLDGWRGVIVAHVAANYAVYKRFRLYEIFRNPDSRRQAADALERHGLGL